MLDSQPEIQNEKNRGTLPYNVNNMQSTFDSARATKLHLQFNVCIEQAWPIMATGWAESSVATHPAVDLLPAAILPTGLQKLAHGSIYKREARETCSYNWSCNWRQTTGSCLTVCWEEMALEYLCNMTHALRWAHLVWSINQIFFEQTVCATTPSPTSLKSTYFNIRNCLCNYSITDFFKKHLF